MHENAGLTRGGVILFALLAGGDYGPGLTGFGSVTALTLAQAGFGDRLLHAVETMADMELKTFLAEWRHSIRTEPTHNPSGQFKKGPPSILALIVSDNSFPDLALLRLYHRPLTSWSHLGNAPPLAAFTHWIHCEPNIEKTADFCAQYFDWDTADILNTKFASRLWEPMFLQLLYLVGT